MKFLLDTHTFLWFIDDGAALSSTAKSLIEAPGNTPYLSMASLWEIAIKVSIGKLTIPSPFQAFIMQQISENRIELLDIKPDHIGIVGILPFHHRDPFDRLIIAQAMSEKLPIISKDENFKAYGLTLYW